MSMRDSDADLIIRHGTVLLSQMIVEYDIRQPAPTQWVAVGTARPDGNERPAMEARLITGTGPSEIEAIRDMCYRLMAKLPDGIASASTDQSSPARERHEARRTHHERATVRGNRSGC
jgi:hypothetical protein